MLLFQCRSNADLGGIEGSKAGRRLLMTLRDTNLKLKKNVGYVGSLMGGISLLSLINHGFTIGWVDPLRRILEQYLVLTNTVRYVLEPCVVPAFKFLANVFSIRLVVGPWWPDILVLMLIYLGSRVKAYVAGESTSARWQCSRFLLR